jgi:uncharacterized protein YndB with AHSA1/START domain
VAVDSITIAAPRERVFAILADPLAYRDWVVGTRAILGVEGPWPEPESSLRYEAGFGGLRIRDRTIVLAAAPPRRLELLAKARPFPDTAITLTVRPAGSVTVVSLVEHPANPVLRTAIGPLGHRAVSLRNRLALRRLKRVAERG